MNVFHEVLYRPLFNLLIWLYNVIPGADIGFAIIALTVVVKLVLWPLTQASLKSQKALQDLQPKLDELKAEHKDNKEALAKAMMELYSKEKVNPLSSCLPILVQIPILIALYKVLSDGLHAESLGALYQFVQNPGTIDAMFLGKMNLGERSILLAILSGIFQYIQTRMLISSRPPKQVQGAPGAKDEEMLQAMNKSMLYFMPVMTTVIGFSLPGGLTLYWVAMNVVSIIQQYFVFKKKSDGK